MTNDDMMRMAREAGWEYADNDVGTGYSPLWKFGELVAAAEREKCADELFNDGWGYAAKTIRARGQG